MAKQVKGLSVRIGGKQVNRPAKSEEEAKANAEINRVLNLIALKSGDQTKGKMVDKILKKIILVAEEVIYADPLIEKEIRDTINRAYLALTQAPRRPK